MARFNDVMPLVSSLLGILTQSVLEQRLEGCPLLVAFMVWDEPDKAA